MNWWTADMRTPDCAREIRHLIPSLDLIMNIFEKLVNMEKDSSRTHNLYRTHIPAGQMAG